MKDCLFVAATGQNVGKTTLCLGLISGFLKRYKSVGYLKPVGQEQVEVEEGVEVDKDVLLFRSCFSLSDLPKEMSPILFPRGFTRDFLDEKVSRENLTKAIDLSFNALKKRHEMIVIEGTGHTAVGSIVDLNNAQVAAQLKAPMILIASGGLGSSFDELELHKTQCEKYGVKVAGVILNRVMEDKREMILHYMKKALKRWDIPLLGAIPYDPFLSTSTMADFEHLFQTSMLSGTEHRWRHFTQIRLVATSVETYRKMVLPNQLIITPAGREDIVLATLAYFWDFKTSHPEEETGIGIILTGKEPPKDALIEQIRSANIPMLYVPLSSFAALKMINTHTAKIRKEDIAKIKEAVSVVESHVDFEALGGALT